jgi:hypothetical protein
MKRLFGVLGAAFVAATLLAPVASAKRPEREPKVIELEEMIIEGKVAKPTVFYVLGRSAVRYEGLKLDRSFVDRIVESARQNPF